MEGRGGWGSGACWVMIQAPGAASFSHACVCVNNPLPHGVHPSPVHARTLSLSRTHTRTHTWHVDRPTGGAGKDPDKCTKVSTRSIKNPPGLAFSSPDLCAWGPRRRQQKGKVGGGGGASKCRQSRGGKPQTRASVKESMGRIRRRRKEREGQMFLVWPTHPGHPHPTIH